jgi:hypothetical protein
MLIKAPGKLAELMAPDRSVFGSQNVSSLIGKKIEQKRAQLLVEDQQRSLPNVETSNFNTDILKSRFATELTAADRKATQLPAIKPTKSEQTLVPLASKYLLEDNPVLGGKPKLQVIKPRDKQFQLRSRPKLEPLEANIFETHR